MTTSLFVLASRQGRPLQPSAVSLISLAYLVIAREPMAALVRLISAKDPQRYRLATVAGGAEPCEDEVIGAVWKMKRLHGASPHDELAPT